ncbi:zinc finger protein 511 [Alosa sapidissima]|uniref:zinc finger protein 511 n=1 Tax=Alosa sapidissima TaxID=34773 RepID=UPI001C09BB25|nr:zinc finger protein 511 [Alosa sapidissima]
MKAVMLDLHPNLTQWLDSDPEKAHIDAVPVLPPDTEPTHPRTGAAASAAGTAAASDYVGTDGKSLFTFRPQTIRLSKDHEFFEDGDVHRHMYLQDLATCVAEDAQPAKVGEFCCHISGCSQLFESLEAYEHHYSALHRHVCATCRRCLPSTRLLDIHILEWHDSLFQLMAQKQSMYQCLVEGCELKFSSSVQRKDHLIKTHSYPADFRFDKTKKSRRLKEKAAAQQRDLVMEVCEEGGARTQGEMVSAETCESMDCGQIPGPGSEGGPTRAGTAELSLTSASQKPRYTSRVPQSICFGQGSVRGFRGRGCKKSK